MYNKAFDFYGHNIRLLSIHEREAIIENVVVKEKNLEIAKIAENNYLLET